VVRTPQLRHIAPTMEHRLAFHDELPSR